MGVKKRSALVEIESNAPAQRSAFDATSEAIERYKKVRELADSTNEPEIIIKAADLAIRLADLGLKEKKIHVDAIKGSKVFTLKKADPTNG